MNLKKQCTQHWGVYLADLKGIPANTLFRMVRPYSSKLRETERMVRQRRTIEINLS